MNLEFICLAMMTSIKPDLMENEESAVLGMLMSWKDPNPDSVTGILDRAQRIRESIVDGLAFMADEVAGDEEVYESD